MHDSFIALIRTVVPAGVGAVFAWILSAGVEVDPSAQAAVVTGLTAVFTAVYYSGVRLLASRWSWVGWLLGSPSSPTYGAGASAVSDVSIADAPQPTTE